MEPLVKSLVLKLFLQALGYILPILVLHYVSADTFGDYVVQNSYALVTSTLLGFSIANTHIFFDNKSSFKLLLNSSVFLSLLLIFFSVFTGEIWFALAAVYSLQKFNNAFLRDKHHITKFFAVQMSERILFLALVLLSVSFLKISLNIVTLMVMASAITTVPVFIIILIRKYGNYSYEKENTSFKDLMSWSIRGHIGVAAQKVNNKFDIILLSTFLSNALVGYYYILVSLSILVWTLPDALNSFLLKELVKSDDDKKLILIKNYTKWVFISVMVCLALYSLGSSYLLSFYSGFPAKYSWMLIVLTLGTGCFALAKPKIRYFTSKNLPEVGSRVALIGFANTLIIAPLLIWQAGITGAVIASSFGYVISAIYVLQKPMIRN